MLKVGITADDFGYCKQRNKAIIKLCKEGLITKLSLLVNAVEALDAVELAKPWKVHFEDEFARPRPITENCQSIPAVGLHLNLTEGKPVSDELSVPSLLNRENVFHGKFEFRDELQRGNIVEKEIKVEIHAQIVKFKNLIGYLPAYVDGHQHIHVLPKVQEIFADALSSFGIAETRVPYELNLESCDWISESQTLFLQNVCKQAVTSTSLFKAYGLKYSQYFIGLSTMGKHMTISNVASAFERIFEHLKHAAQDDRGKRLFEVEFMVHPGFPSIPGSGGCGLGPDEFSLSHERQIEFDFLRTKFRDVLSSYQGLTD